MDKLFYKRQDLAWSEAARSERSVSLGAKIQKIIKCSPKEYREILSEYDEIQNERSSVEGEIVYMRGLKDGFKLCRMIEEDETTMINEHREIVNIVNEIEGICWNDKEYKEENDKYIELYHEIMKSLPEDKRSLLVQLEMTEVRQQKRMLAILRDKIGS